ncbi:MULTISPECIES: hypothetical protein [Moorena]|nr:MULTISPECIES: hypothetical protein [Moorena]NEP32395.1 hypothetical protein [Moorena sp. SIO3B2]NEP64039.1 hypothetical protein [Moorena sp. SIO3A5]NES44362.1 hypothetical protein [Moorena sp. SIO2C4]OLT65554.1 hypothetical protein BI334_11365 [Moorena producens 3L]
MVGQSCNIGLVSVYYKILKDIQLIMWSKQSKHLNWINFLNIGRKIKTFWDAYYHRLQGEVADNKHLAIDAFQDALTVFTSGEFPQERLMVLNNLGITYLNIPGEEQPENQEQAIAAFEEALTLINPEKLPNEWTIMQYRLGMVYRERIRGEQVENLELANKAFEAALKVSISQDLPEGWV